MEKKTVDCRTEMKKEAESSRTGPVSFYKSALFRNIAVAVTGTTSAQAITMIFSPLVARIYGPDAFGILGTFSALVAVMTPLVALSYPIAIIIPKEDNEAAKILYLSVLITLTAVSGITLILLTLKKWYVPILSLQKIEGYLLLLPLALAFGVSVQIFQHWFIRKKHFKVNAQASVIHALFVNLTKVISGLFWPLAGVLIAVTVIGSAVHGFILVLVSKNKTIQWRIQWPGLNELKEVGWKYYDFPLFRTPQAFLNAISSNLPIIMLTAFFGPVEAGFYVLCRRVLKIPTQWIGKSVGDVFYVRVNEAINKKEDVRKLLVKASIYLATVGFVPFVLVVLFGPNIFKIIFGTHWLHAGEYARWLAIWLFFAYVNKPVVAAIPSLGLQGFFLLFEIVSISIRAGSLLLSYYLFRTDLIAIKTFSAAGAISNIVLILSIVMASKTVLRIKV